MHGRSVKGDQCPSDRMDAHFSRPIRNLQGGAGLYNRRSYAPSTFAALGRWNNRIPDGQFFRASDRAAKRGDINLHYGSEPGSKFYSHLSDQYGYFGILPIGPTESEAFYVLDGLFDHDTILEIEENFTDTGGASDYVFALFALIGKRFAPRLRSIKDRKFHTFEKGRCLSGAGKPYRRTDQLRPHSGTLG